MNKEIQIGDVVELKSGSPGMTVQSFTFSNGHGTYSTKHVDRKSLSPGKEECKYVNCSWMIDGDVKTACFSIASLCCKSSCN